MIRWFSAHPTAANLLLILLLAAGVFSAPHLKRETFPDYRPTEVSIDIIYRGASATDVEDAVCRRVHDAVKRVDFLDEFKCVAQDNLASSTATMLPGGNALRFLNELQTEVNAITDLPARADKPIVRELHRSDLVMSVAVSGPMSQSHLEDYALRLEQKMMALPGVASVYRHGQSQRQWQIEINRDVLAQYGLSARDLAQRISSQNIDLPLGILETADSDILLRFTEQRRSIAELASLVVISHPQGGVLTLGQIATISERGDKEEEKILFNGKPAIILEVHKSLRDDALSVKDSLEQLLEQQRNQSNQLIELTISQDMTSIVRDRLQMLVANGIAGLILVVLVMSLFFRPSLALWVVLGLPAAFMGSFIVMAFTGLSINMITLVALLMAIGIVMDDAIVITDNIAEHASEAKTPLEAVVNGTRQVLPGVLSSFLTTVAVFMPLAFLAGELGSVLEVLPVVLIAALAASLLEAFWILPHHLKGSVAKLTHQQTSRFRQGFDRRFAIFRQHIGKLTDKAIQWRYWVLGAVFVVMIGSIGFIAGGHIGSEAMPDIDGDVLEARILMPQGTPLEKTEAVAKQIEAAITRINQRFTPEQPEQAELIQAVQVRYNYNVSAREAGPHVASVIVDLLTAEQRTVSLDQLTSAWLQEVGDIAGIERLIIQEPGFGPAGVPVEIRLQGDNLSVLQAAAQDVVGQLQTYSAVYNVMDDLRLGKPQRTFSLAPGSYGLGLSTEDVASQLRTAYLGDIVDTQRIGDQDVEILLRQHQDDRNSLDDLSDQTISLHNGKKIPLQVATEMKQHREWAKITHIDGRRTVTIEANVDARMSSGQAIVKNLKNEWLEQFQARYPTIDVKFEGQVARSAETGSSIARGLLMGLVGIFVILSFQFRSYAEPLIVMLSIPLAFIGALWGHVIMGYYMSMPSLIGAASLAGIVVNNAILLIHFIKTHRKNGMDVIRAAGEASRDRLRAIFISSSTTIVGLVPLLAETSTQSAAIKPLVISVVFGLLSATVLVIFIIPAIYVLFAEWGWAKDEEE